MIYKLLMLAILFLSGCSIISYDLRDKLLESELQSSCNISFILELKSGSHTHNFGAKPHETEALKQLNQDYVTSTLNTLSGLGCNVSQASRVAEANFIIHVSRQLQLSALPQEWLTGLSLGLIPSWGTKHGQFVFTFTNSDKGRSYTYTIDQNNYNHIIFFPVFWVTLLTADEQKAYVNALTNFIKSF
jgi:hypothetical protein